MHKKANPTVIGAFLLGAMVLVVAGIMVFGSGQFLTPKVNFVLYFDGSVNGLNNGAPVKLRGVKIGQVTDVLIELNYTTKAIRTPVYVEVEPDRIVQRGLEGYHGRVGTGEIAKDLIEQGLRGQLQVESFVTGQLYIEFDMLPGTPVRLVGGDSGVTELPTVPSALQELTNTLKDIPFKEIFNKISSALEGINRVVNSPELLGTLQSGSDAMREIGRLARHADGLVRPFQIRMQTTLDSTNEAIQEFTKVAQRTNRLLDPLELSLKATLETAQGTLKTAGGAATDLRDIFKELKRDAKPVVDDLEAALEATRGAMTQVNQTLVTYQNLVAEGSRTRYDLDTLLVELRGAARAVRILADYLERNPQSLLRGKGDNDRR